MKNAVLKCNQLDQGWYVAKSSSHSGGESGGRFHIFKVEDDMMPHVLSLCGSVDYRNINNRCFKEKVGDPEQFLEDKRDDDKCSNCCDQYNAKGDFI